MNSQGLVDSKHDFDSEILISKLELILKHCNCKTTLKSHI